MQRLTSRFPPPSGNCPNLPKGVLTVPRMPRLPFASAPTSEDKAAGCEPPARHGLPEIVCVVETVARPIFAERPA